MNSKKVLSLILCMCMIMTLFAGCGMDSSFKVDTSPTYTSNQKEVSFVDDNKVNYEVGFVKGSNKTETENQLLNVIDKNMNKTDGTEADDNPNVDENGNITVPFDQAYPDVFNSEEVEYADNSILIKVSTKFSSTTAEGLKKAGIGKMVQMFSLEEDTWYTAYLCKGVDVNKAMEKARQVEGVKVAEYNFKYETTLAEGESLAEAEVSHNPHYNDQWAREKFGIRKGWRKLQEKESVGSGGGSSSVIVAVIDTGVDYNHVDLKANMWVNSKETPNNGIDDDGNGKVDDYYGYDATANKGSGMDDHGHGTHVAGIIGASNNKEGIVGYAYNAKIMAIKAGDASGYFLQDNIAEAIIYAYDNGADVINMSFGGTSASIAVQDALAVAYTRCVLVAAAGNDGLPNEVTKEFPSGLPNYPAAFSYVLGVMSVGQKNIESLFTNWDVQIYNDKEYEVYAPGEQIISTLPNNKYGKLSGTSMAAPVVAAQAALLRSYYDDYNKYPTKFIYGQIVGTADNVVLCCNPDDHKAHNVPGVVNFYDSMTELPVPDIGLTDYIIFDTETFVADTKGLTEGSEEYNNGDGVIDSGEIIALGFTLRNRWGMSENTKVHIDAVSMGGVEHPYLTFLNNDLDYKSVGTYSESDSGKLYSEDGEMWNGWENPFYIKVSKDCPNDYTATINITVTYENALDSSDNTVYTSEAKVLLKIRRGTILPNRVSEDMTLTKDNYYIIPNAMLIEEGATVTVEAGTKIQFWTDDPNDSYADTAITYLKVDGKFICNGTETEPVELFPSGWMDKFRVEITSTEKGWVSLNYTKVTNPFLEIDEANNCEFLQNYKTYLSCRTFSTSGTVSETISPGMINIAEAKNSAFYKLGTIATSSGKSSYINCIGTFDSCIFVDSFIIFDNVDAAKNCVFYGNNNYWGTDPQVYNGGPSNWILPQDYNIIIEKIFVESKTETTYIVVTDNNIYANLSWNYDVIDRFAQLLGGSLVQFNSTEEFKYVIDEFGKYGTSFLAGVKIKPNEVRNIDGSAACFDWEMCDIEDKDIIRYDCEYYDDNSYSGMNIAIFDKDSNSAQYAILEIPGEVPITDIQLDDYLVDIDMASTYQVVATVSPATADPATLVYESQDEGVVKVDGEGNITPVAPGTTTVRVYAPDYALYNYITVNVKEPVELASIEFEKESITLAVGKTHSSKVLFKPTNTTKRNVDYVSSNEEVATVNKKGVITAKSVGTTVITATGYNGLTTTMTVNVVIPAESIAFEEDLYVTDLQKDDGIEFYPIILPEDTTDKSLIWESSNPEICYVNEDGKLVKLSEGTAVLKATLNNTTLNDTVIVKVSKEKLNKEIVNVKKIYESTFALLEDGTLWVWNGLYHHPKQVNISNVKDFVVYSNCVVILDKEGEVRRYYASYESGVYDHAILSEDVSFSNLNNIAKLSAEHMNNTGSFFAITNEGAVWAWGDNNYGRLGDGTTYHRDTPVLLNIPEKVEKIISKNYHTYFLTNQNHVYVSGRPGEPYLYCSEAIDINDMEYNSLMNIVYEDYVQYCNDEQLTIAGKYNFTKSDEKSYSNHSIYMEGNEAFITTMYWDSPCATPGIWTKLEGVGEVKTVFDLHNNVYIQTEDGKFYSMGSGSNNALGTGSTADTKIPHRVYIGVKESNLDLSLTTWNYEGNEVKTINQGFVELDFNYGLDKGNNYIQIAISDTQGNPVTFVKHMELDKLTIVPHASLTYGETYTLTIPEGALTAANSDCANEEIVLTFTYMGSGEAGDGTDGDNPEGDSAVEEDPEGDSAVEEDPVNEAVVDQDKINNRHQWTSDEVVEYWNKFVADGYNTRIYSSAILNRLNDDNVATWLRFTASKGSTDQVIGLGGNYWGTTNKDLINKQILDFDDYQHLADINEGVILTEAPSNTFPFVVDAYLEVDGEQVDTVGNDLVTFVVEFNRDMDTTIPLDVRFGSAYPYADYIVEGEYESPRVWKGTMQLTTIIENGYQYWSVTNGKAAGTSLKLYTDWGRFPFKIDTTAAQALTMQAVVTETGIQLTWEQDDFDTLAGYNVYRSTEEDGQYTKINRTVIPADTKEWFDDTVEPGQRYYYNFTVVQSDMTESEPSGKVSVTAMDTMAPNIYHSPAYHAFTGSNLVISATVTDNVGINEAKLYYRTTGTDEWKVKQMTNNNDKYSAVIPASDITVEGLEYYIEATDGISNTYKGTADDPYAITVQVAVTASQKGDINGDGTVTLQDAIMVLYAINDRLNLTEEQFAKADLDDSGVLEAKEALRILQYVNGTVGTILP